MIYYVDFEILKFLLSIPMCSAILPFNDSMPYSNTCWSDKDSQMTINWTYNEHTMDTQLDIQWTYFTYYIQGVHVYNCIQLDLPLEILWIYYCRYNGNTIRHTMNIQWKYK